MSDAQRVIANAAALHSRRIDPNHPNYGNCRCGLAIEVGFDHADHLAAEIDKALGGLTRAWAAVLPDGSFFGPYHERAQLDATEARRNAEADVAEYEDAELKSRWVSGWSEVKS